MLIRVIIQSLAAGSVAAFMAPNVVLPRSSALFMGKSLLVLSPPGGVGEVAVVKAATMGGSVKWFVVSGAGGSGAAVAFQPETLKQVEAAGGSVELAGADAPSLLDASALPAFRQWCGGADALICTMDGVTGAKTKDDDPTGIWKSAIKVAAKEASLSIRGMKLAILPADEEDDADSQNDQWNILSNLFGNKDAAIPVSLPAALGQATKLRHGELFGTPESSPNFSAIVGGPLKDAQLTEEYAVRGVRVDPTMSVSGNAMMGSSTRSSRHAVGQAAALMVMEKVPVETTVDLCVTSLPGKEAVSLKEWQDEFARVEGIIKDGKGAQLFTTTFSNVPDVDRLADWLATKWAPAVLRTYDIAGIRIGARPVYATRTDRGEVQIVWQELVDFSTEVVGKMVIQVSETGMTATRAAGDASKGFGTISRKPLNGEDVLVRQLAEAASQAVGKGLAQKAVVVNQVTPEPKKPEPVAPIPPVATATLEPQEASSESGPRQAGARRSSERARGTRQRRVDGTGSDSPDDDDQSSKDAGEESGNYEEGAFQ